MVGETAELVARLSLKDDFSAKVKSAQKSVKDLDRAFSRTQASLGKTAANLQRVGVIGAGAIVTGLTASVKIAADFESQLNTINTIARVNQEELGKIGDTIRQVARDTGTPLEELTQGYYDLLSAGISAADAAGVLTAANKLAIGGLASTAETVDLLTPAINAYGADAADAAGFADIFAKAVERGKVTAADIATSFSQVGLIAKESGIEIEEVAAAYARLTAGGTDAAEVSTQMRSALVALTKLTGPLERLQKQTGKNYLAIAGSKGLAQALEEMRIDAEKSGVPLVDLLGRVEGLNFALAVTGPNFAAYNADLAAMGDAAGTASGQMAERQKGLNFQLARLKALAKDAGITIGSALLPKLTPLVEKLNDFITKNQGNTEAFGTKLAQGFEDFAAAVGKVDWQPFIDGLTITGQIAKDAIGLFMSLPPDVQKIAIAALAVNKVTGGLGTSIVKDLAGLALRSLTHITAAQVTVIGGSVTGAGGGTGVVTGGAGKIASAVRILGTVALAAGSIALIAELWNQRQAQSEANKAQATALGTQTQTFTQTASLQDMKTSLAGIEDYTGKLTRELTPKAIAYQLNIDGVRDAAEKTKTDLKAAIKKEEDQIRINTDRIERSRLSNLDASARTGRTIMDENRMNRERASTTAQWIVAAIQNLRFPPVTVTVAANSVTSAQQKAARVGGINKMLAAE